MMRRKQRLMEETKTMVAEMEEVMTGAVMAKGHCCSLEWANDLLMVINLALECQFH